MGLEGAEGTSEGETRARADERTHAITAIMQACELIREFNRGLSQSGPSIPAEVTDQLIHIGDGLSELFLGFGHLCCALGDMLTDPELTMDSLTSESDAYLTLETARLFLEEAQVVVADLRDVIHAAAGATSHVVRVVPDGGDTIA